MQMYRYPPAGWLSLEPDHNGVYTTETPCLLYQFVGIAWAAPAPFKLREIRIGGGACLSFGEDPMPLRRFGWLLAGRYWPPVHHHNGPRITIDTEDRADICALIVPTQDDVYNKDGAPFLVSEADMRTFARNMGTIQMWDSWPACVGHDEQAERHHADLRRQWRAWIERAAAAAEAGQVEGLKVDRDAAKYEKSLGGRWFDGGK